jgi:hypothetical protein
LISVNFITDINDELHDRTISMDELHDRTIVMDELHDRIKGKRKIYRRYKFIGDINLYLHREEFFFFND